MTQDLIGTAILVACFSWSAYAVGYERAQRRFDKPDPLAAFIRNEARRVKATRMFCTADLQITSNNTLEVDGERFVLLIRQGGEQ